MIYFYGEGRLGNQVFQYHALAKLARAREAIVAVGLEDLSSLLVLRGPKLIVLTRNGLMKRLLKFVVVPWLIRPLIRTLRLANYAAEGSFSAGEYQGASGEVSVRRGLFSCATFVDGGHYQNSAYWSKVFPVGLLTPHPEFRTAARSRLLYLCGGQAPVFVHVRRTDYLKHTDYGIGNLGLPLQYYLDGIVLLRSRLRYPHLVFVTDDPNWVKENFKQIDNKSIVSSDVASDFCLMTECVAGIVSNSTFSMAAALMLRDPALVIAPEYWNGFRVGAWYPPKIQFQHPALTYIRVNG